MTFEWDKAEARERDAWIAEHVMGLRVKRKQNPAGEIVPWVWVMYWCGDADGTWVEMADAQDEPWSYSTSVSADYRVLERVRNSHDQGEPLCDWDEFLDALYQVFHEESVPPRFGGHRPWEVVTHYRPGCYSKAAWIAVQKWKALWETADAT